jgi:hypothetical protein
MGSKRQLSNSLVPVLSEDKNDKKLKGLMGTNPNSEKGVVKVGLILFFLLLFSICCMLSGCASSLY